MRKVLTVLAVVAVIYLLVQDPGGAGATLRSMAQSAIEFVRGVFA